MLTAIRAVETALLFATYRPETWTLDEHWHWFLEECTRQASTASLEVARS